MNICYEIERFIDPSLIISLQLDRIVEQETLRSQIKAFDDTNEILLLKE